MEEYIGIIIGLGIMSLALLIGNLILRIMERQDRQSLDAAAKEWWGWSSASARAAIEDRQYERKIRDHVPLEVRQEVARSNTERSIKENEKTIAVIDAINKGEVKLTFEEE